MTTLERPLPAPVAFRRATARVPHLGQLWVLLTVVGAFLGPASSPIDVSEIGWTLASGRWMLEHRVLLTVDPFTSAPPVDGPIVNQQWLAQVGYALLERGGGLELVVAGTAAAVAAAYALVLAASVATGGQLRLACAAAVFAYLLGFSNLVPRPQTLAYPLFGVFVLVLARAQWQGHTRALWLLPAVTLVWANVHGSFVLGLLLLGCAAVGTVLERRSPRAASTYAMPLLACGVAACVTPYGPGALAYVAGIGSNVVIRDLITEWAPTSLAAREGAIFFVSLIIVGALALRSPVRLSPTEVLLLAVFGGLALSSIRSIVWWGLVVAPIAARLARPLLPSRGAALPERAWLNAGILAATLALLVASLPWLKDSVPILPADKRGMVAAEAPTRAAGFLAAHAYPGKLFNHQLWGGYLDWALAGRHQPFVDGRIEIHPTEVWLDYLRIVYPSARWRELLDQYGIGYLLLHQQEQAELIDRLGRDPGWQTVYADEQAVIYARVGAIPTSS